MLRIHVLAADAASYDWMMMMICRVYPGKEIRELRDFCTSERLEDKDCW